MEFDYMYNIKNPPLRPVSIVVPVYNSEQCIARCIESVKNQTYTLFELIVVDDGSTDRSSELLDKYAAEDQRIKVIHQENKGEAGARNTGLNSCTGEYVLFLDADDMLDSRYIEIMVDGIAHADMAISGLVKVHSDGKSESEPYYTADTSKWCWPILNNLSVSCWRCIYYRQIIEDNKLSFTSGRRSGADQEFSNKYMLCVQKINYVPQALYYYIINAGSIMHQKDYRHFDAVEAMKAVESFASVHLDQVHYEAVRDVLHRYKYPYILEFAILNVLSAQEKPFAVRKYLENHRYYEMLNEAVRADPHWDSEFIRRWKASPSKCLWYYYVRRMTGNILRSFRRKQSK